MSYFDDPTHRYAPDSVIIAKVMRLCPVVRAIAHPAGTAPVKAIRPDCAVLELATDHGSRWYGCERAYINSELRMVVVGHNSRDEVRQKWEVVPADLQA